MGSQALGCWSVLLRPAGKRQVSQGLHEPRLCAVRPHRHLGKGVLRGEEDLWREKLCRSRGSFCRPSTQIHKLCYTNLPPGNLWEPHLSLEVVDQDWGTACSGLRTRLGPKRRVSSVLHGTSEMSNDVPCICAYAPAIPKKQVEPRAACAICAA